MAIFDLTAANAALKELYDGQVVENLVYKNNPFLALVPKKTDFGGKYYPIPIQTGVSQGRSGAFATAQANQSAIAFQEFLLTRKSDYSIAQIDNQTMLASATDKMAFINGAKRVVDGAIRSATNSLASKLFRAGTGTIGQISSISTGVITLVNPADVVQFEVNMTLQANATDGGTPRAAVGYVVNVDRAAGTVTVASSAMGGSAATPTGWTTSDFLLVQGDVNAAISGLAAWLPTTAPTSTLFYGVDRSVDTWRLGGGRYNGQAQSLEEAIIDASALVAREGGMPDTLLVSYASYSALEKSLGSKVQYIDMKGPADIGFKGIMINGANSMIKVVADRNCQAQTGFLLQMDTWELATLGEACSIQRYGDGLEMLRVYNADAAELRVATYGNLACFAPGWNSVIQLSA